MVQGVMLAELKTKGERLEDILRDMGSVLVAYSGGVDSAFLAVMARRTLGEDALAVTAVSPAVPDSEVQEAVHLAKQWQIRHRLIYTQEMDDPNYVANGARRCYYCKTELYSKLLPIAQAEGLQWIANGTNCDDLGDYRPGLDAAKERGVRSPLVEAGLLKAEIRSLSQGMGLSTWDKPAMACLSSRFPYGTPIMVENLTRVGKAEAFLRSLGIKQVRVRHHDKVARIEVSPDELEVLLKEENRLRVVKELKALGYTYITLDLAGYRSGSLNEVLKPPDQ